MTTIFEVLRRPLVTEKSNYQSSKLNQYTFEVTGSATKAQIKDAVETLFDVAVERVNVINLPAKRHPARPKPPAAGPPQRGEEGRGDPARRPVDRRI